MLILLRNILQVSTAEDFKNACLQARHESDKTLFVKFFKNGYGLRITVGASLGTECSDSTVEVGTADYSEVSDVHFRKLCEKHPALDEGADIELLRSIKYSYGFKKLFKALAIFKDSHDRKDYPNLIEIIENVDPPINAPEF